jgi:hypothetical protein
MYCTIVKCYVIARGTAHGVGFGGSTDLRHTKIAKLDHSSLGEKNILGLEVTVEHL